MTVKSHRLQKLVKYQSFECQLLSLSIAGRKSADNFAVAVVYRPPSSFVVEFYDDLSDMFDKFGNAVDADNSWRVVTSTVVATTRRQCRLNSKPYSTSTTDVSSLLDVVIGRKDSSRLSYVTVQPSYHASYHDLVTWSMTTAVHSPPRRMVTYKFRSLKKVDWAKFDANI